MIYLAVVIIAVAVALWKISNRTDPHHVFIFSLLPLLDLEHSAGTRCNVEQIQKDSARAA